MAQVFKIVPTTQKYDWGKVGSASKVAQYAAASHIPGFVLDEGAPYAELWMGTHPSGPAHLFSGETLAAHLAAHPELVGSAVTQRFEGAAEGNLPFLFKVLAIEKALSIQTHPDKKMAEELHKARPDVYKDANHKPEMALALTPFTALCGFQPLPQIAQYLASTPEFAALIPPVIAATFATSSVEDPTGPVAKAALKDLFAAVMTADAGVVATQLATLVRRYAAGGAASAEVGVAELVQRLDSQFPGDVGVFCAFMLNYVRMAPGEAIFLAAGEPHAYISGDIVECMATSDNVIRAGLTPKLRDVPHLVAGLTYAAADPRAHLVAPARVPGAPHTASYAPPVPEFAVLRAALPAGARERHAPLGGPSIALVAAGAGAVTWGDGEALEVGAGDVLFAGAGVGLELAAHADESLVVYRAYVEA